MTALAQLLESEPAVAATRAALADSADDAWVVGGTVRDLVLGRPIVDVDLAVEGDPEQAARALADGLGGPLFPLSEEFGAWRVLAGSREWFCDVSPLQGDGIEADLARRDFTVNAIAVPLEGGEPIDPHGGRADLDAAVLRVVGEQAYEDDPLRALRLARLAAELGLEPEADTERLTRAAAARVPEASAERVFAELRRLLVSDGALSGIELAERTGVAAAVLPELEALRGIEQSQFHHLDVHDHTIEVLRQQIVLESELEAVFGELAEDIAAVLAEPLGDGLTRGQALRFGALVHDLGKPATRGVRPDGRVTFIGHDGSGAELVLALCRRLRTGSRVREQLAALTRHHLRLGFLVHHRPLAPRMVHDYLSACGPVALDVTVLSCADRLATGGKNAEGAIAAHLELARELAAEALRWHAEGPPRSPVGGRELIEELGIEPGPQVGRLLRELEQAAYAGEVESRQQALELAGRLLRET
jgi:putative nucleotidyltransferase with HDIG domain